TRSSPGLAQTLVRMVNEHDVFTSPATYLALFDEVIRGLNAQEVGIAARRLFGANGPLVYLSSPVPITAGERDLIAAYHQSRRSVRVPPPRKQTVPTWTYTDFGLTGEVV